MKKPVKIALWGLIVLCVLGMVGTHLAGPRMARTMTTKLIEQATGCKTELGELNLSLWRRTIELTDVKLFNPHGFEEGEAVWIRRLYAEPTWDAITGKRAAFRKVELDIAELLVIQPKEGGTNMEQLGTNAEAWQAERTVGKPSATPRKPVEAAAPAPSASAPPSAAPTGTETQIDELTVRLGTVTVVDHVHGGAEPLTFRHEINREKTLVDVTDLDAVSEELLMEFTVNSLMEQIAEPLNELMPGLANELQGFLKQLSEPSVEGEGEGAEDPIEQFKDVLEGLL